MGEQANRLVAPPMAHPAFALLRLVQLRLLLLTQNQLHGCLASFRSQTPHNSFQPVLVSYLE